MAFKTPTDLASTTLASSYTTGSTSMVLSDGSRFDAGGGYVIILKNDRIWQYSYTSRASNTLSGLAFMLSSDGSADENHLSGTSIKVGVARDYIKQILDKFTSSERLKHEWGGIEADISAVQTGDILVGTGSGTIGIQSGATARASLGLAIGTNVQAYSAKLDTLSGLTSVTNLSTIAGLATTTNGFIVADGSAFGLQTDNTARHSLGLGTQDSPTFTAITTNGQGALSIGPFGTSAGNTGEARFLELAANGANYVGLKAPSSISSNIIWTLPSADATSAGQSLQSNASGILSWATTLNHLVDDTSPTLGGMLNVSSFAIGDGTSELIKFVKAASAVNEVTLSNAATGNVPSITSSGDDSSVGLRINAKGTGDLVLQNSATGSVGIGITTPSAYLDIQRSGNLKANTNFIEITNSQNGADMDGTETSIHFNQFYFDATTPAAQDAGRISVGTEADWTSTTGTRDSYMAFHATYHASLTERLRITSLGRVGIRTTIPASTLHIKPDDAGAIQIDAFGTGGGQTGELRFLELAANGSNYIGMKAPDDISGNSIYVLPAAVGAMGQVLKIDSIVSNVATLGWTASSGGGGLGSLQEDTSPDLGGNLGFNGFSIITSNTTQEVLKFNGVGSGANEITVSNAATGNSPTLSATGDDTNIAITLAGKGTGAIKLGQATSTGVVLVADQPIQDSSANAFIKFTKATSAVNQITVANAATGSGVSISATGSDSNIALTLAAKGTGAVTLGSNLDIASKTVGFTQGTVTYNSGTTTVDWTTGIKQSLTFGSGNITTLAFTDPSKPCNVLLKIKQDGTGSRTITNWPAAIKWANGTVPTLSTGANAIDMLTGYFDGTNYFCSLLTTFS